MNIRTVQVALATVAGVALIVAGWFLLVQPLLGDDDDVAAGPEVVATPTLPPVVTPDGGVGLPQPVGPDPDALADIDALIELGEVSEEVFQIAGARDPFRQVVVEAQVEAPSTAVAPPSAAAPPADPAGAPGGTPAAPAPGTPGVPGTPNTPGTGAGDPTPVGPGGVTALAATGLGAGPLAVVALLAMLLGLGLLRRPTR